MVSVKSEYACKKLVAPLASFFFKVVAEGPGTHHFKESKVVLVSYGININGTNTSLHVAKSGA